MLMFGAALYSVLKLPTLERRFGLVLMGTLALAMFPLTWEDRRPVWFTLGTLIGFSQAILVARRAAAVRPVVVGTVTATSVAQEGRAAARRQAGRRREVGDLAE